MRSAIVLILALGLTSMAAAQAPMPKGVETWSAFALSRDSSNAPIFGHAVDQPSQEIAEAGALSACRRNAGRHTMTPARGCEVQASFSEGCLAYATGASTRGSSAGIGGSWTYGWASDATEYMARVRALQNCDGCQVRLSFCANQTPAE